MRIRVPLPPPGRGRPAAPGPVLDRLTRGRIGARQAFFRKQPGVCLLLSCHLTNLVYNPVR